MSKLSQPGGAGAADGGGGDVNMTAIHDGNNSNGAMLATNDVSMVAADMCEVDVVPKRPQVLEKNRVKRFAAAVERVKGEMDTSRKTVDMLKKLDRRFDTSDVEAYLPTAARHILH